MDDEAAKAVEGLAMSEDQFEPVEQQQPPQDLQTALSEPMMVDSPKTETTTSTETPVVPAPTESLSSEQQQPKSTPTTRGRGRGRGRGGRGASKAVDVPTVVEPETVANATPSRGGTRGGRGSRGGSSRNQQQLQSGNDASESSDVEMKSPGVEDVL